MKYRITVAALFLMMVGALDAAEKYSIIRAASLIDPSMIGLGNPQKASDL
jgi:hypothetical protein